MMIPQEEELHQQWLKEADKLRSALERIAQFQEIERLKAENTASLEACKALEATLGTAVQLLKRLQTMAAERFARPGEWADFLQEVDQFLQDCPSGKPD